MDKSKLRYFITIIQTGKYLATSYHVRRNIYEPLPCVINFRCKAHSYMQQVPVKIYVLGLNYNNFSHAEMYFDVTLQLNEEYTLTLEHGFFSIKIH